MKPYNVVASQKKNLKIDTSFVDTVDVKTYAKCVIANDAPKKLDFLILIIETLQIKSMRLGLFY